MPVRGNQDGGGRDLSVIPIRIDRKSTRLNSSHANIYTLSLHDALPICSTMTIAKAAACAWRNARAGQSRWWRKRFECYSNSHRSEEHTSELQSRQYLHSFPTRRSSDLFNYDYCKGCGMCVAECPCGAIKMVAEEI